MSRALIAIFALSFLGTGCAAAPSEGATETAALRSSSRPSATIAAGAYHSCAIREGGEVWCWGNTLNHQLGNGQPYAGDTPPARVVGLEPAVAVTTGFQHTCAITAGGSAWCWGCNVHGQLGDGSTSDTLVPVQVYGLPSVLSISPGFGHTCAARSDGEAYCWGHNYWGELGDKSNADSATPVAVKRATGKLTKIQKVEAGAWHTCALRSDGEVFCWGDNDFGELGDGTFAARSYAVNVAPLDDAVDIAAGERFSCAVRSNGKVRCWGRNSHGQLGSGCSAASSPTPVTVPDIDDAVAITLGEYHACALRSDGTTACWGGAFAGEYVLGTPTVETTDVPIPVVGLDDLVEISLNEAHTLALRADGTLFGWGRNTSGEIDHDATDYWLPSPVEVPFSPRRAPEIAAGEAHTCALAGDGTVRCFGANTHGQLGDGTVNASETPVTVSGLADAGALAAGADHTCAVRAGGTVWCWGRNDYGQLGNVTWTDQHTPVKVYGLGGATGVCTGKWHTCAVLSDGRVRCWGRSDLGQLGDAAGGGSSQQPSNVPLEVVSVSLAVEVACGDNHTCARRADGTLYCWGLGSSGQRGNGTTQSSGYPVQVTGIADAKALSAAGNHTCAVHVDGTASCWGANVHGQLGDQSTTNRSSPTPVSNVTDAVAIAAGSSHTCVVLGDGGSWCWGDNASGQLGDGTNQQRTSPVSNGLSDVFAITAGGAHSCAALTDGSLLCWGDGASGQLGGDGTLQSTNVPAPVTPF